MKYACKRDDEKRKQRKRKSQPPREKSLKCKRLCSSTNDSCENYITMSFFSPLHCVSQDNRLQSGDHILQIGDVNLRGMGSEQVAAVLRQSGTHVRLVVARPVEPTSPQVLF